MKSKGKGNEKVELIKPKSKRQEKKEQDLRDSFNKNKKFISPVLMAIVGFIFLTNSNTIIIYACYILGIISIAIGLLVILLSSVIETFLNIIIGTWLIITGITKLIGISELYSVDKKTANLNIIEAIIVIAMGLYSIFFQNIVLTIIGIWRIIGAGIDLYNLLKTN